MTKRECRIETTAFVAPELLDARTWLGVLLLDEGAT